MANKPTKAEYEGFKKAVANPMTPAPIKQKLQSIIDQYSSEYEGGSEAPKAEPKSRAGRKPFTTKKYKTLPKPKMVALITATKDAVEGMKAQLKKLGYNPEEVDALNGNQAFAILEELKSKMAGKPKRTATPRATKKTATDIEKAKAEIKAKTGKTEAECEAIIEQYRSLRSKAQEGKRKAEQATATNKKRVAKLEDKGDLIEGTNVKTADAVIETTAQDVAEKIEQQIEAVEEKAEKEAVAEVAKDNTKKTPTQKKQAVEAKVEKKVKEKTRVIVKKVVIDTTALLTSIATSLGKFDKDSQKEFLIKLRSDIDKLLAKYAFGGMTDGAVQTMNVQQSNLSSSSVNPTMFDNGGVVGHPIIDVSGGINVGKYVVRGYDGKSAEYSLNKKGLKAKNSDDVAYFNSDEADKFIEANRSKYLRLQKHRIRERTFNDDVADYDDFVDRQTNIRGKEYANGGGVEKFTTLIEYGKNVSKETFENERFILTDLEDLKIVSMNFEQKYIVVEGIHDLYIDGVKIIGISHSSSNEIRLGSDESNYLFKEGGGVSSDQRRKGYIYGYEFDNPYDTETFRNYLDRENIDYYSRNGVVATKKAITNNELSNIGIKQKFSEFAEGGGVISVYELRKGDKIKTRKGDIETIERKIESGYFTYESKYSHPFESIEFVERPKRKMANGGGVDGKGRYHILGEVKGKKPILFASTDDKKSISKIVKQADRDFFDLTGKKHEIFVTDSITDEEVYHYADGGVVGQEIVFDDSGEENTGVIKEITNLGDYVVKSDDGRTLLAQRDLDVISFGAMRQQGVEQRKKRFGFFKKGGLLGSSAQLEFIDEAFASSTLQDALREKLGLDEDTNRVGDNVVISFAYTDYGGDFLDKVAIEYFQRFYPDNTLVEYAGYNGENAFVFGEPAQEWIDSTEDYPLGFDDIESFYYEKVNESEYESYEYFLDDLERDDYVFDREEVLEWLMENRGGYYSMTTQGLDFSYSDLTDELLEEGLISKEDDDDDDEYARGGGIKDVIVYDNNGETFDRYTIFTPDGSVYGMSDNALMPNGFNMYIGDNTEIEKGSHLGKKLKSVPESIKIAVERRMSEEYAKGGITEHGLKLGDKIIGASGSEGEILNVYNRGKQRRVNIQTGERSNFGYAKGGKLWIDTKGKGGLKGVKPSRKNTFRNEAVKRNMTSGQLATKVLASPSRYKGINPRSAQLVKNMGVRKQGGSIGDILRNRRGE